LAIALSRPKEFLAASVAAAAFSVASLAMRQRHEIAPWSAGCTTAEIASALSIDEQFASRLLAAWHSDGRVAQRSRFWHLPEFTPVLQPAQRTLVEGALVTGDPNPLVPGTYAALHTAVVKSTIAGMRDALEMLFATGALVRVGDDVYRRSQIDRARDVLIALFRSGGGATMSGVRDAFG